MAPRRSVRVALPLLLLGAGLALYVWGWGKEPPRRELDPAAFERIYRQVPPDQVERLLAFRATHPYKELGVAGAQWRYIACGQGDLTVLLLPGGSRLAEGAFVLITLLEADYRIIAPCYPPVRTMGELSDGLAAILEAEGVRQADVYGASFGGMVAQCLVRRHPERVRRLVLANTGIPRLAAPLQALLGSVRYLPTPAVLAMFRQSLSGALAADDPEAAFWRAHLQERFACCVTRADAVACFENGLDFMRNWRLSPSDLAGWPGQVLVLESDRDQTFKPAERQAVRDLYPQAQVHVFRDAPHEPWRTHREEYLSTVKAFLRR